MSASQALVAGDVLDAFPLRESRRLLDVGGGDGTFLCTAAARWAHLQLMLFDLPPVAARARARFERDGLAARAEAFGGDLMRDPLPEGADVVSLVRVLHDHDDDAAMTILRAARAALPADGTLLIAEPMSATPGAQRVGEAYFGFYLMAMGSGRPRTPGEIGDMLGRAGFAWVRLVPTRRPLQTRLMTARPA
jgi:demethylspheroidene O-methyltransferase